MKTTKINFCMTSLSICLKSWNETIGKKWFKLCRQSIPSVTAKQLRVRLESSGVREETGKIRVVWVERVLCRRVVWVQINLEEVITITEKIRQIFTSTMRSSCRGSMGALKIWSLALAVEQRNWKTIRLMTVVRMILMKSRQMTQLFQIVTTYKSQNFTNNQQRLRKTRRI